MTAPAPLPTALRYAAAGLPVFPLAGKVPRTVNGFHDATTDPAAVRAWWRRWPDAGIGLCTGGPLRVGGFLAVLDVDPRHDGDRTLTALVEAHGALPPTFTVRTGGGGVHVYLRSAAPLASRTGFAAGLDLKARGGYVVAAPSPHPSGGCYRVERRAPAASLPAWLLTLLAPRRWCVPSTPRPDSPVHGRGYVRTAIERECGGLARTPEGGRNEALNRSAYSLARFVASGEADAEGVVRALTWAALAAGLREREITRTLRSAFAARQVAT